MAVLVVGLRTENVGLIEIKKEFYGYYIKIVVISIISL